MSDARLVGWALGAGPYNWGRKAARAEAGLGGWPLGRMDRPRLPEELEPREELRLEEEPPRFWAS